MNLTYRKLGMSTATALLTAGLAGCGGGSGGPGGPGSTVSFVNFNSIKPSGTTTFTGIGTEVTRDTDATGKSTSIGSFGKAGDISADVSYDKDGDISKVVVTTPSGEKTWDLSDPNTHGDDTIPGRLMAEKDNGDWIAVADIEQPGSSTKDFEYQTFGLWETIDSPTKATNGAFSVGAVTDAANIPTTGAAATFSGAAAGAYSDPTGNGDIASADAELVVNFVNRTATFATTNTVLDNGGARNDLNLISNDLSYSAGTNGMTGTIANAGGTMNGAIDGRFYGPNAEEAGGVFGLKGAAPGSLEAYSGGFGVKK